MCFDFLVALPCFEAGGASSSSVHSSSVLDSLIARDRIFFAFLAGGTLLESLVSSSSSSSSSNFRCFLLAALLRDDVRLRSGSELHGSFLTMKSVSLLESVLEVSSSS